MVTKHPNVLYIHDQTDTPVALNLLNQIDIDYFVGVVYVWH